MKTIHILRYIQEAPLRDAIHLQLNRGEFRHILAKSLFFANWSSFRSGDYEEVMNKASCPSLLSNAVLVWNTVHIARIVGQLRAAGHEMRDEDLARVSPPHARPRHPERKLLPVTPTTRFSTRTSHGPRPKHP